MKIFLTGASSGVGKECKKLLSPTYTVVAPTSDEFNLGNFEHVDSVDLSDFDIVINCAARNRGTYRGLESNDWQYQAEQVNVNFTGPLLLAKQYLKQRDDGHFIYVSSTSIENPRAYNIFMASSKAALRYSMNVLKKEYPSFVISEVCPGKIKTNMLKQNYQGSKTDEEIEFEYENQIALTPKQVADAVILAIRHQLEHITISPR
jgi:short-subunit dehydrogenase